jgi:hypothetical protein
MDLALKDFDLRHNLLPLFYALACSNNPLLIVGKRWLRDSGRRFVSLRADIEWIVYHGLILGEGVHHWFACGWHVIDRIRSSRVYGIIKHGNIMDRNLAVLLQWVYKSVVLLIKLCWQTTAVIFILSRRPNFALNIV